MLDLIFYFSDFLVLVLHLVLCSFKLLQQLMVLVVVLYYLPVFIGLLAGFVKKEDV